ncbi:MAG: cell division protein ZapA [Deltaproteobacteria bacterium]|nr:cell division protein ZapA [Deltaproteobacteria bacterium]
MDAPVRVKIFEHEYLLKSEEGEERLREIADFVNSKFYEIRSSAGQLSDTKLAILTAFYVASDYFQIQREQEELKQDIQDRARLLNQQIEAVGKTSP